MNTEKHNVVNNDTSLYSQCRGIWLRDPSSTHTHAYGIARQADIQQRVLAALKVWLLKGETQGLFWVKGNSPLIVSICVVESVQWMLIKPARDKEALQQFMATVPFAASVLNHFLTSSHDAISVINHKGLLCYISPTHERWLGLRAGEALGQDSQKIIPNSRMTDVLATGVAEIGHPYSADGVATRIVSRIPIRENGKVVGVVGRTLFKGPEVVQRMYQEVSRLQSEIARYRKALGVSAPEPESLARLVGQSGPMQALKKDIQLVANLDIPVLILGESGVGKELVAQAVHSLSDRSNQDMISLNLAALPSSLLESELFGYAPGSFTGSHKDGRIGKFELADKSTIFLDEVGDIPADTQVKLLRVLEDRRVERLGEHRSREVDFRLVAATHRKLDELVSSEQFRLDLFYRLAGVTLNVPSLAERPEDIPELLTHFVQQFCIRNRWEQPLIQPDVAPFLADQAWPGNVRQLRQRIEEALVFSAGQPLGRQHFERGNRRVLHAVASPATETTYSDQTMQDIMRKAAWAAVDAHDGNKQRAARSLGISRSHLYTLLKR